MRTSTIALSELLATVVAAGGLATLLATALVASAGASADPIHPDSGPAMVWGAAARSSSPVNDAGTDSSQPLTAYGQVPGLTGVVPGRYTHSITVTY